jgi:hypothetical protein
MVPSLQALAAGRPVRKPHLAELMPGQFAVPQNPLRDALGMGRLGIWNSGQGVGFPGYPDYGMAIPNKPQGVGFPGLPSYGLGCSDCGYGMGDISTWFTDSTLSDSVSFPNWMVLAAVGVAGLMLFSGGKRGGGGTRRNPATRRNESISEGFYDSAGRFHPIRSADDYDPEAVGEDSTYSRRKRRKR